MGDMADLEIDFWIGRDYYDEEDIRPLKCSKCGMTNLIWHEGRIVAIKDLKPHKCPAARIFKNLKEEKK